MRKATEPTIDLQIYACSVFPDLSPVKNEKVDSSLMFTLLSKRVTRHSVAHRDNFAVSHINGLQLFLQKYIKRSHAHGGSVWYVTLLPRTTFIHVNKTVRGFVAPGLQLSTLFNSSNSGISTNLMKPICAVGLLTLSRSMKGATGRPSDFSRSL